MSVATYTRTTTTVATETHGNTLSQKQPDISYAPDREKWSKRTAQRLSNDPTLLSTPLPEGFPRKLESPLVWEGKHWKDESQWVYDLDSAELIEIDAAVRHFNGTLARQLTLKLLMLASSRLGPPFRLHIP